MWLADHLRGEYIGLRLMFESQSTLAQIIIKQNFLLISLSNLARDVALFPTLALLIINFPCSVRAAALRASGVTSVYAGWFRRSTRVVKALIKGMIQLCDTSVRKCRQTVECRSRSTMGQDFRKILRQRISIKFLMGYNFQILFYKQKQIKSY